MSVWIEVGLTDVCVHPCIHTRKEHNDHVCMLFSHIEGREVLLLMLTFRIGYEMHWV